MGYTDTQTGRNRGATIATVALIHAALGYALVTGFGATVIETITHNLPTTDYTDDDVTVPLPPPPPDKVEPAADSPITAPDPVVPIPRPVPADVFAVDNIPVAPSPNAGKMPVDLPLPTLPPVTPGFEPKAASPKGNTGNWVTPRDYPSRDLRQGNEGLSVFRLEIAANGAVTNCTITRSSGHPGLDAAACRLVSQRARFDPATGSDGAKTAGTYENAIRWQIPR